MKRKKHRMRYRRECEQLAQRVMRDLCETDLRDICLRYAWLPGLGVIDLPTWETTP